MGHRYVQRMVKRYAAKAGIDKNISPHTLRHSFATDLYRETSKIRLVQKVLDHSDLSTTMIYTHIFDEEVESALKSFRQTAAVGVVRRRLIPMSSVRSLISSDGFIPIIGGNLGPSSKTWKVRIRNEFYAKDCSG